MVCHMICEESIVYIGVCLSVCPLLTIIEVVVPWTKSRLSGGLFTEAGPRVCNMLTASLQSVDNYTRVGRLFSMIEAVVHGDCF